MRETQYHSHSHKHEVKEFRAPTDESVKLLHEFEGEARNKMISSFKLEKDNISAMVFYQYPNIASNEVTMHIRFELNGKQYDTVHSMGCFDYSRAVAKFGTDGYHNDAYREWMNLLGKVIAVELMKTDDFNVIRRDLT